MQHFGQMIVHTNIHKQRNYLKRKIILFMKNVNMWLIRNKFYHFYNKSINRIMMKMIINNMNGFIYNFIYGQELQ